MGKDSRSNASGITRDDWLRALQDVGWNDTDERDAVTRKEFAAMLQIDFQAAVRRLEVLVDKGMAVEKRKRETDGLGRMKHVIAYRLKKTSNGKVEPRRSGRRARG